MHLQHAWEFLPVLHPRNGISSLQEYPTTNQLFSQGWHHGMLSAGLQGSKSIIPRLTLLETRGRSVRLSSQGWYHGSFSAGPWGSEVIFPKQTLWQALSRSQWQWANFSTVDFICFCRSAKQWFYFLMANIMMMFQQILQILYTIVSNAETSRSFPQWLPFNKFPEKLVLFEITAEIEVGFQQVAMTVGSLSLGWHHYNLSANS